MLSVSSVKFPSGRQRAKPTIPQIFPFLLSPPLLASSSSIPSSSPQIESKGKSELSAQSHRGRGGFFSSSPPPSPLVPIYDLARSPTLLGHWALISIYAYETITHVHSGEKRSPFGRIRPPTQPAREEGVFLNGETDRPTERRGE